MSSEVIKITATGIPLDGNDIDTDRIIPARFLCCVTFDGLGEFAFEDDRKALKGEHVFDQARFAGAGILVGNKNFGCGSSREHAPQALARWGLKALIAESFAEIFFGNCVSLGLPCLCVDGKTARELQTLIAKGGVEMELDIQNLTITVGAKCFKATLPDGPRQQFLTGHWDALGQMLENYSEISKCAKTLPYMTDFAS